MQQYVIACSLIRFFALFVYFICNKKKEMKRFIVMFYTDSINEGMFNAVMANKTEKMTVNKVIQRSESTAHHFCIIKM